MTIGQKKNKNLKVAIALSGGVDSGVAAGLLVKKGYQVSGFHLRFWQPSFFQEKKFENKCCSSTSLEVARKTCYKLGIPFYVLNFQRIFKKKIVDYFLREYGEGRTPNPCVMCNKYIKFGVFLDYVWSLNYDYLATGHYARILKKGEKYYLLSAKDKVKDQSYFLYNLTSKQLSHILFPVGDYFKEEIRKMAREWKLPVAERPESQEICFLPGNDYRSFLRSRIPQKIVSGEVVDLRGRVIGRHFGLPLYTVGQRHGFLVNYQSLDYDFSPSNPPPLYVIKKDTRNNRLVVGLREEAERREFLVKQVNWINPDYHLIVFSRPLLVRIRHQGKLLKCVVERGGGKKIRVILEKPELGIAGGQAAVFYSSIIRGKGRELEVLGGGIIDIK